MSDVILDDEGNEIVEAPVTEEIETSSDQQPSDDQGEDERGSSDDELNDAETDDERDAIRARRREERKHRKEAQREREETLRRELASRDVVINEMRSKLDVIERRNTGSELAQIDNAKKEAAKAYAYFRDQIAVASETGNHRMVADATDKMLQAQRKFDEFTNVERAFKQRQSSPQPLDPRLVNQAQTWMGRNNWYDPSGKDQDSRIALSLDNQLAEEGWDPTTPQYWQELDTRVKKYLPHRTNSAKLNSTKPRSIVQGSGREAPSAQPSKGYKLSADRVQAIKDAGAWDDPKARAALVASYREYDKQNQGKE
mgnify:CR=1 FL=1